jgi:hypothetical protein
MGMIVSRRVKFSIKRVKGPHKREEALALSEQGS